MEEVVYIVSYQSIIDGVINNNELMTFSDEKSARNQFSKWISSELDYIKKNHWIISNDTNFKTGYYCAFEQNNFAKEHILIQIHKTPVLSNCIKKGDYFYDREALEEWTNASKNAVTLWETKNETLKVEITNDYVKFFRQDDTLSVYTYPSLKVMRKDEDLIRNIDNLIDEAYIGEEREYHWDCVRQWQKGNGDYPVFPISFIFNSDYQNYTCKVFE